MAEDNSKIFNRALVVKRRNRAATHWAEHDFLKREAVLRLADALDDMKRTFALALDLGCHKGELAEALRGRVGTLIGCDCAESMSPQVVCDEEFLSFAPGTFDLVISALALHHVNDLPGTFIQIRESLKPDGLFLAMLPGASSLKELRASITGASAEHGFALSPRLSPLIEVRDAGALLQRAGFALPVVDSDIITVKYDNPFKLMQDLHGMGEGNVLVEQRKTLASRAHLAAIAEYYQTHFGSRGTIPASFEFITMTGWKPHPRSKSPRKGAAGKSI